MKLKSEKIISIFLTLCILISVLSVTGISTNAALTDEVVASIRSGGFEYGLDREGIATIQQYRGTDTDLVIPSTIDGHIVRYIGEKYTNEDVNRSGRNITSLTIPDTVVEIYGGAFKNCKELTTVNFSNGLEVIGEDTFLGCKKLTSINLPDSITTINCGAFQECGLTTIDIPDNVTTIGRYAFYDCNIESLILNTNIENMITDAFGNVKTLYLTKNVVNFNPEAIDIYDRTCKIYYEGNREEWASIRPSKLDEMPWVKVYCNKSLEKPIGFSSVVADNFTLELTYEKGDIQSGEIVLQEGTYEFNIHKGDVFNVLDGKNIMGYNKTITDSTKGQLTCNPKYKSKTKLVATGGTYRFEFNTKTNSLSVKRTGNIPKVYFTGVNISKNQVLNLPFKPVNGTSLYTASIYLLNNEYYYFKVVSNGTELGRPRSTGMNPEFSDKSTTVSADGKATVAIFSYEGFHTFTFDQETNTITAKRIISHNKDIEVTDNIHIASGDFDLVLDDNNGESNIATGTITLKKGVYSLKLYNRGVAYGSNSIFYDRGTRSLNSSFKLPSVLFADGGKYSFTFDKTTGKLAIMRL